MKDQSQNILSYCIPYLCHTIRSLIKKFYDKEIIKKFVRFLKLVIVLNKGIQSWSVPGRQIVECLAKSENKKKVRMKRGPERGGNSLSLPKETSHFEKRSFDASRFETNSSSEIVQKFLSLPIYR